MLLKFDQFSDTTKIGASTVSEELSNLYDEFDEEEHSIFYGGLNNDELLTSICKDLYRAYRKDTGREGRIITNFEEFYFYRLISSKHG